MRELLGRLFPAVRPAEQARFLFFVSLLALVTLAQTLGLAAVGPRDVVATRE